MYVASLVLNIDLFQVVDHELKAKTKYNSTHEFNSVISRSKIMNIKKTLEVLAVRNITIFEWVKNTYFQYTVIFSSVTI